MPSFYDQNTEQSSFEFSDDKRVTNNVARHQYRTLTDAEKADMKLIKDMAEDFILYCRDLQTNTESKDAKRNLALAITHMEDASMRAVRAITE